MNEGGGDSGGESGPAAGYFAWGDGRPRVLQVVPSLEHTGGGVERSTLDIAHSLADCGATPLIASAGGRRVFEHERIGAPHLEMPLASKNPFVIRANAGRLARVIKKHEVDLVQARNRAPAWSAYRAARRTGSRRKCESASATSTRPASWRILSFPFDRISCQNLGIIPTYSTVLNRS